MPDLNTLVRSLIEVPPCVLLGASDGSLAAIFPLEDGADVLHPADILEGLTAPAEYDILAIRINGRAHNLGTGEDGGRVMLAVGIDRAGNTEAVTLMDSGLHTSPPDGSMLDLMRACFGLPALETQGA